MSKNTFMQCLIEDLAGEYKVAGEFMLNINRQKVSRLCYNVKSSKTYSFRCDSQLFISLAILRLAEQRCISLSSTIEEFIPEYDYASMVTVLDLLNEHSGIPDYKYDSDISLVDYLNKCGIDKRYKASKTDAILLQIIFDKLCDGKTHEFILNEIFAPCGIAVKVSKERFVFSADAIVRFVELISDRLILKKTSWRLIETFDYENNGICCKDTNGTTLYKLIGNTAHLFINVLNDYGIVFAFVSDTKNDEKLTLLNTEIINNLLTLYVYPKAPRLMPYNVGNASKAISIRPAMYQLRYVCDVSMALAYVCANTKLRKAYLFRDCNLAIGILTISSDKTKKCYSIDVLIIDEKHQSKGYGKLLLSSALDLIGKYNPDRIQVAVNKQNVQALNLYKNYGFTISIEQEDYYVLDLCLR